MESAWSYPITGIAKERDLRIYPACLNIRRADLAVNEIKVSSAIAKQLNLKDVKIISTLSLKGWTIFHVDTVQYDKPFLLYSDDPRKSKYVLLWAGPTNPADINWMAGWVSRESPGVPSELAKCFAWDVTVGPDHQSSNMK